MRGCHTNLGHSLITTELASPYKSRNHGSVLYNGPTAIGIVHYCPITASDK